jgi:hypothetical protein
MWWFSLNIRISIIIPRRISHPDLDTLPFIEGRKRNFLRECPRWSWFTEGFDTADLQEAKTLLEELGEGSRTSGLRIIITDLS